ncbi:MAG: ribosome maturation factor RimM [Leptospiraceae bacterium]|nr:ribosome maturation factor RimM [Leptospiraceae bacterium]
MEELQKHFVSYSRLPLLNRVKTPNSKSSISPSSDNNLITIGTIASSHGIHGWAKVKNFGDSWTSLKTPVEIQITKNLLTKKLIISHFEIKPNYILIRVESVAVPEFWDDWRSAEIQIDSSFLPTEPLEKDEFYIYQLENLEVLDEKLQATGFTVTEITETPAHFILICSNLEKKILIPFLNVWVGEVNLPKKFLVVKDWESWIEI